MRAIAEHEVPTEYIQGKPSMIPTRKIDSNKIKENLGWEAKTTIQNGLRLAYDWYLQHKNEFN
jgi:nucleoside-diphosphate-sugar epimerase